MVAQVEDMRGLPFWPRLLRPEQAAAYCGMSLGMFRSVCPVVPTKLGRGKRKVVVYDRKLIDEWIDRAAPNDNSDEHSYSIQERFE